MVWYDMYMHRYKLDGEEVLSAMEIGRVTPVPGDLSRPLLGLDDTNFKASRAIQHGKNRNSFQYSSLFRAVADNCFVRICFAYK